MSKFVTCLNCMDGRVQLPVINWLKQNYSIENVDMITEAGMDGFLVNMNRLPAELQNKIYISLKKHGSGQIFIVGHHDCGGHPVDEITHRKHTMMAVDRIKMLYPECKVYGLWVSEQWEVEQIAKE
jgi:carbonic anhydrase